jgi:hypothetical protein
MPSTPTTKSQVQAYRFVLRRMQSALVRKDSVMLHDPMRTHSRATAVGVVIAVIGMLGFLVFGLLKPAPTAPDEGIVIGKESGQVYVKTNDPPMLIPTFNLASARLLVMARAQQGDQDGGGAQAAGGGEVPPTEVVGDDQLKDIPRARPHGIPDGPPLLPSEDQRIPDAWAVCDQIDFQDDLPSQVALEQSERKTTVLAGVEDLGREIAENEALLVVGDNEKVYLVYRLPSSANRPNANTVRAEVDMSETPVLTALNLINTQPRKMSTGMLDAIPEVEPLRPPQVRDAGEAGDHNLRGLSVGDVFGITRAGGVDDEEFYVVLREGIQPVSRAVADMIRFRYTGTGGQIPRLQPDILKLDIALTNEIHTDPARRALCTAMVSFAREIDATIVAEGIETAEEQDSLRRLQVPCGQGYHIARPQPLT